MSDKRLQLVVTIPVVVLSTAASGLYNPKLTAVPLTVQLAREAAEAGTVPVAAIVTAQNSERTTRPNGRILFVA